MMTLLARIGMGAMGPWLVPLLIVGILTTGGLAIKARDTRIATAATNACNAGWEKKIRDEERALAANAIREAQELAANTANTAERLQHDLDDAKQRNATLEAGASADPNCAPAGMLDALQGRWDAGRGGAGAKKR